MDLKDKFESYGFNYAAIDIGSNAVRLLIKHVEEDRNGKATFSKVLLCACLSVWDLMCLPWGSSPNGKRKT